MNDDTTTVIAAAGGPRHPNPAAAPTGRNTEPQSSVPVPTAPSPPTDREWMLQENAPSAMSHLPKSPKI